MFWSLYQCLSPSKIALKRFGLYTKVWRWAVASLFFVYVCTFQTIFKDKHFLLRWPIILRPWVRIPSTPSILFSICNVEIGIGMRKGRKLTKKGPARTHIFLIEPCSGLSLGPIHKYFFRNTWPLVLHSLTHWMTGNECQKCTLKESGFFHESLCCSAWVRAMIEVHPSPVRSNLTRPLSHLHVYICLE